MDSITVKKKNDAKVKRYEKERIELGKNTRKAEEEKWKRIVSRTDNAELFSRVIYNMMVGICEPANDYNN